MNQILDKAMEKIKTFFSGVVTPEEIEALKQYVQLADMPTPPPATPEPSPAKEVKTVDGVSMFVSGVSEGGNVEIGMPVYTDAAMTTPAPNGDYALEGGLNISVMDGKVAEVATKEEEKKDAEQVPAEMAKVVAQMSEQKQALEVKFESQSKEISELKAQVVLLSKHLTKILETPINTVQETKVDVSKMSAFEYRQYKKSLENNG